MAGRAGFGDVQQRVQQSRAQLLEWIHASDYTNIPGHDIHRVLTEIGNAVILQMPPEAAGVAGLREAVELAKSDLRRDRVYEIPRIRGKLKQLESQVAEVAWRYFPDIDVENDELPTSPEAKASRLRFVVDELTQLSSLPEGTEMGVDELFDRLLHSTQVLYDIGVVDLEGDGVPGKEAENAPFDSLYQLLPGSLESEAPFLVTSGFCNAVAECAAALSRYYSLKPDDLVADLEELRRAPVGASRDEMLEKMERLAYRILELVNTAEDSQYTPRETLMLQSVSIILQDASRELRVGRDVPREWIASAAQRLRETLVAPGWEEVEGASVEDDWEEVDESPALVLGAIREGLSAPDWSDIGRGENIERLVTYISQLEAINSAELTPEQNAFIELAKELIQNALTTISVRQDEPRLRSDEERGFEYIIGICRAHFNHFPF